MVEGKKRKLLLVVNRFYPQVGGAEINVFLQSQELGKYYDVEVFSPIRADDPAIEKVDNIEIQRFYNVLNPWNIFPYLGPKTICPNIFWKIIFGDYDVIHCFPAVNYNNILAIMAGKIRKIPVFLTNFDLHDYAQLMKEQKTNKVPELSDLPIGKLQKYFLPKYDAIFTISKRETDEIRKWNRRTCLSTVPIQMEEIDQEIDVEDFKRRFEIPEGKPIILCLSRVSHIKGQDILLEAIPGLKKRIKDFFVLIVGARHFEPEFATELDHFVEDHELQNQVMITGAVSRHDALAALKACNVHVLPMRFMNSGAVVAESWAACKPVLQSTQIDPNYVVEQENGLTFNPSSVQDLEDKLFYLLKNPEKAAKMGMQGRQLVESKFLYPHLIEQYMKTYESVLYQN